MAYLISMKKAIMKGLVKQDDYIAYSPDHKTCVLTPKETGWEKEQNFETEDMNYLLVGLTNTNKFILVSDKPTEQNLCMRGKAGYVGGLNAQHKLCDLFSLAELEAKARSMDEKEFEQLSEKAKMIEGAYWLSSRNQTKVRSGECVYFDIHVVISDEKDASYCNWNLFVSDNCEEYGDFNVRPVIYLPSNILVVMGDSSHDGSSPEKAWEIVKK